MTSFSYSRLIIYSLDAELEAESKPNTERIVIVWEKSARDLNRQKYVGKPSETDSIKSQISPKTPRQKKDSTKRHHQRQQFPIQVVTG